jgi:hypothetical protein
MSFEEWFNEIEVFSTRGERFYDDLLTYKWDGVDAEYLVKWLKAAYNAGREDEYAKNLEENGGTE